MFENAVGISNCETLQVFAESKPYFLDGVDPRGGKACASEWRSKFTDLRTCVPEAIHICKFRNLGTWMHVDHGLYKPRQRVRTKRDTIASIASRNELGQ